MLNDRKFFVALGKKVREMRLERCYSLEDMEYLGFPNRHWQQIEKAERRINSFTLLRICNAFEVTLETLIRGLDEGIYEKIELPEPVLTKVEARKSRRKERLAALNRRPALNR